MKRLRIVPSVTMSVLMGLGIVILLWSVASCDNGGVRPGGTRPGPGGGNTGNNRTGGDNDKDRDTKSTKYCVAKIPDCNKKNCCGDDNKDCEDGCSDFFPEEEEDCESLPIDDGNKVIGVLESLKDSDFSEITSNEDLKYLCMALDIEDRSWTDLIRDNNASEAQEALEWIAENQKVTDTLLELGDTPMRNILRALLMRAGGHKFAVDDLEDDDGDRNDVRILKGLKDTRNDFLEKAVEENNNDLVEFVHEEIVEASLCDSNTNKPDPVTGSAAYASGAETTRAGERDDAACLLGVYCYIYPGSGLDDEREDIASVVDEKDIENLIEAKKTEGGLAISKGQDWPHTACTKLKTFWNNGSGLALGL